MSMQCTLYGDDGKGNVKTGITVGDGQKFWFKGYVMSGMINPITNKRVDVWFDEYSPEPPYTFRKSWWLCTVYTNNDGYFDSYPYDTCWLKYMGQSTRGFPILQLWQAKLGKIWEGEVQVNLGFKAVVT